MSEYVGLASGDPKLVAAWRDICAKQDAEQEAASRHLRALGMDAEHPDDGWVNRERNEVYLSYPRFTKPSLGVGSQIALGWPWSGYRIVRVTGQRESMFGMVYYSFEDTGERVPRN